MKLIIASSNKNKITEIKQILQPYFTEIISQRQAGITAQAEENGETFMENALIKARHICALTREASLADDSGLCVDALGGEPGVHSARYSGGGDLQNNLLLLSKMKGVKNRKCRFVCAAALCFPDGSAITAEGVCEGELLYDFDGEGGFGYDSIFYSLELKKSFGKAAPQEKNSVSHRYKALKELARKAQDLI
jgi:XTP/dITP diphosphohydrolase